ncbi:hypothetical protein KI387_033499, partial [Taxus chinensis]
IKSIKVSWWKDFNPKNFIVYVDEDNDSIKTSYSHTGNQEEKEEEKMEEKKVELKGGLMPH